MRDRPPLRRIATSAAVILATGSLLTVATLRAQQLEVRAFHDLDGDGTPDPGEPGIEGLPVAAHGPGAGFPTTTGADGRASWTVAAGCHGIDVDAPAEPDPALPPATPAWRRSFPSQEWCPPAGSSPVGRLRHGSPPGLYERLLSPSFEYISLGDSLAAGFSFCFLDDTNYVEDVAAGLECIRGSGITFENRAINGSRAEDFLTPVDTGNGQPNPQYVPTVIAQAPDLVTISIGGNDFLNTEPDAAGQAYPYRAGDLQRSFQELIDTRRTVQEALSSLVSGLPNAEIEINTVYDNLATDCTTTDFHAAAPTLWNQMLRSVAWGQRRPVAIAEVFLDFAHQDVLRATCCGEPNLVCAPDIHVTGEGALTIGHAVLEALGRVEVGAGGGTFEAGYEQLVATLHPKLVDVAAGTVSSERDALVPDGVPASVGFDAASVTLSGFDLPAGITPSKVVVGVRFRTTGTVTDDIHRFDASFVDFAPPEYSFTGWDTVTPLVGGSGRGGAMASSSRVNALPNVPAYREVTALVTLNPVDDGRVTGWFTWPAPTASDVAALAVRLTTETVGTPDGGTMEWDGAWAWVYGTRDAAPPPDEVSPPGAAVPLTVAKEASGLRVAWQAEPASETYRLFRGALGDWTGASCDPATQVGGCATALELVDPWPAGAGSAFYLVAGVNAGGVQGPLGARSDGQPRTDAGATCP